MTKKPNFLIIPYKKLKPETLKTVVEELVTRNGTDYGESEVATDQKVNQVMSQLKSGNAVLVFDPSTKTCNIVLKKTLPDL